MKEKVILILIYVLLALVVCAVGIYWFYTFAFDDIINYYCGGILRYIFILIMLAGIILPIVKYRKYKRKWVLPMVLILIVVITPIFNNGILKFIEDELRIYSKEKWEQHKDLRIYMLDDLETHYLYKGSTEEYVINLLGEPDFISGENSQYYEYYSSPGYLDPIMFYVEFKNGLVVEEGKRHT